MKFTHIEAAASKCSLQGKINMLRRKQGRQETHGHPIAFDPNEIMQILANELAPLKLWLELAVSYYQQHRMEQFNIVMETSTGDEGSS